VTGQDLDKEEPAISLDDIEGMSKDDGRENHKEMRKHLMKLEREAVTTLLQAPYTINGIQTMCQLDSCCDTVIISQSFCESNGIEIHERDDVIVKLGNNSEAEVTGACQLKVQWKTTRGEVKAREMRAYVMRNAAHHSVTFGLPSFPTLGLEIVGLPVEYYYNDEEDSETEGTESVPIYMDDNFEMRNKELDEADSDVFISGEKGSLVRKEDVLQDDYLQELKRLVDPALRKNAELSKASFCNHPVAEVKLELLEENTLPVFTSPYNTPMKLLPLVNEKLEKLKANGVIVKMQPGQNWNSPLLVALKKDENNRIDKDNPVIRLCLDTRKLNAKLKNKNYKIPVISELFAKLKGTTLMSILDVEDAFHQIKIREEDIEKLSFRWQNETWAFARAPFGLKVMVSHFQALMETLLQQQINELIVYLDDIVVFTKSGGGEKMEDVIRRHADKLIEVIETLTKYQVRLNQKKCRIGYTKVRILGHILSGESRCLDPDKMRVLSQYTQPTTGKQIMAFLGFTNYLRDYIALYSELAAPLERLRNVVTIGPSQWTQECQESFEAFKRVVIQAPVLHFPLDMVPYEVWTDASNTGVGAALVQRVEDKPRFILMASKALTSGQRNYSATRRELLAIIFALQRFREYLYLQQFKILTDHRALAYMLTQEHLNGMLSEWVEVILDFDFTIHHLPGILNQLCDSLSRQYPNHMKKARAMKLVYSRMIVGEYVTNPNEELKEFIKFRLNKQLPSEEEQRTLVATTHKKGHFGANSMFKQIWQMGYYWQSLMTDCIKETVVCGKCLQYNVAKRQWHPAASINSTYPMEHVALDVGSFNTTSNKGNHYFLVIVDLATRFIWVKPIPNESAMTLAKAFIEFAGIFDFPNIVQSDNGTGFVNEMLEKVCSLAEIDKRRIASVNPRANGSAEKSVDIVKKTLLKSLPDGNLTTWDEYMPLVQLNINSRIASRHRQSPLQLLFARGPRLTTNGKTNERKLMTEQEIMQRNQDMMNVIFPVMKDIQDNSSKRQNAKIDERRNTRVEDIERGTEVMIRDINRTEKTDPTFVGPYKIVERRGNSYVVEDQMKMKYDRLIPIDQMKILPKIEQSNEVNENEIYEVSQVVDDKMIGKVKYFRIRWKNYTKEEDTWQKMEDLHDVNTLQRYWRCKQFISDEENNVKRRRLLPGGKGNVKWLKEVERIREVMKDNERRTEEDARSRKKTRSIEEQRRN
jgi:transposase InsO family protein